MWQQNVFISIVLWNKRVILSRTFSAVSIYVGEQTPFLCSCVARGSGRNEKLILLFSEAGRIRDSAVLSRFPGSCLAGLRWGERCKTTLRAVFSSFS